MLRIFEGRFGRLLLSDLDAHDEVRAQEDPVIVLRQGDPELVVLNPGKSFRNPTPKRALVFHVAGEWLHGSFPAAFDGVERKPFAQQREPITARIRRAIALLRAHPNKDLNIDQLANQVGLSRSRFYDLFQLCTGFSPRAYLDLLCIEAAISRLSSGRGKIAELSAELGFSAQSNFTRFFHNQVGVPPSEYRRAASRPENEPEAED